MRVGNRWSLALAIATTVVLFSSAFPGVKIAMAEFTPGSLALLRFAAASFAYLMYVAIRRPPLPRRTDLPATALVGLLGVSLYHVVFNTAQKTGTARAAGIFLNTG